LFFCQTRILLILSDFNKTPSVTKDFWEMKKIKIPCIIIFPIILFILFSFYGRQNLMVADNVVQDTSNIYKDGLYEGKSRSSYTDEPYWGSVRITVKGGSFTEINFMIRDSDLHETFNENYEKHFQGNPVYIQQCRNDWNGVQTYPKKLSESQNTDKVDAISGATWSYNIFKASAKEALKNAKKQTDLLTTRQQIDYISKTCSPPGGLFIKPGSKRQGVYR